MEDKNEKIISYLTFNLGEEEYAAHVSKVLNILEMTKITKVPQSPDYMKGVINLRGMVLPVIDTRLKFGMEETEYTDKTCIVVMDLNLDGEVVHVGALVDKVNAVLEIDEGEIQPAPSIGTSYNIDFITGMVKKDEQFIMILDLIKVFSVSELNMLKEANKKTDDGN